ncbi:hypothetical protein R5R35_006600 [Gryllus longicercus]|uniref:small monomeric GTPase n=1 Tax=Gryllus longicercus TaxID=2509291 RepID=A0AAN9VSZ4_9ORTH
MKTEEKAPPPPAGPRVRIAVLGKVNVGKSALTVRFLTRRFIGEYRSNTDLLYRQTVTVNSCPLEVEIVDVSGESRDRGLPLEAAQWADACVLVYSITDRASFEWALLALAHFRRLRPAGTPTALLANKADLEHLRAVAEAEGRQAALQAGCAFCEVSVAENSAALYAAFEALVSECCSAASPSAPSLAPHAHSHPVALKPARKFSVTKMIGTLIGGGGAGSPPKAAAGAGGGGVGGGGTVVECHKADLHRSRVLQRRQNFSATASL